MKIISKCNLYILISFLLILKTIIAFELGLPTCTFLELLVYDMALNVQSISYKLYIFKRLYLWKYTINLDEIFCIINFILCQFYQYMSDWSQTNVNRDINFWNGHPKISIETHTNIKIFKTYSRIAIDIWPSQMYSGHWGQSGKKFKLIWRENYGNHTT